MNDDVAATVIEALALRVRSLEGELLGTRLDGNAMIAALRKQVDAAQEQAADAQQGGQEDYNDARRAAQEARTLALEVLARGDTNAAMRRRAERIVAATPGAA